MFEWELEKELGLCVGLVSPRRCRDGSLVHIGQPCRVSVECWVRDVHGTVQHPAWEGYGYGDGQGLGLGSGLGSGSGSGSGLAVGLGLGSGLDEWLVVECCFRRCD